MKAEDFIHLQLPHIEQSIEDSIDVDPIQVALRSGDAVVANQVKYLQRAGGVNGKLPSWFTARCVIDSTLYEQCSSERAASEKFIGLKGDLAIDLTCGLGVDSAALAANFQRVISVEIDSVKASIARYNFAKLGLNNIEVVNDSAENFCANNCNLKAGLIYIDPSRQDNGRKIYSIEDSSPNVLKLMSLMLGISPLIKIKLSPLFDVKECFAVFKYVDCVYVISINGECKEVLVNIDRDCSRESNIVNNIVVRKHSAARYALPLICNTQFTNNKEFTPKYLHVIDVAFYKSRTVESYLSQFADNESIVYDNYVFSVNPIANFEGATYLITNQLPYSVKSLKTELKRRSISRVTIHIRNFPHSLSQIKRDCDLKDGSDAHLFFTTFKGKATVFFVTLCENN